MGSFTETRADIIQFRRSLRFPVPHAICDRSLAYLLGIHCRTLWGFVWSKSQQYHCFAISKRGKGGGRRDIQNPKKRLKYLQKVMLVRILNKIPVGDHIGAYVPGRACKDTAAQHVGKGVVISMDIKDFFPSVKRSMIKRFFNYVGYPHRVSSLIAEILTFKNFLPQGAPTSGMMANLVADLLFDRKIIKDLRKLDKNWTYTRYSDDIDLSHPKMQKKERIYEVIDLIRSRINEAGFQLNERKTKLEPRFRRQKILGIVVNEKINIPRLEYMRIRCMIHNCLMHGFASQVERANVSSTGALISHIQGKISYFKQVDERKSDRLKRKFEIAKEIHSDETEDEVDFATNAS